METKIWLAQKGCIQVLSQIALKLSLIENLKAEGLIADRAYDSDEIITFFVEHYKIVVIPPKKSRKVQRDYDKEVYKMRHFVENVILDIKRWRRISTRYAKLTESFLAAVFCRCIAIWAAYLV